MIQTALKTILKARNLSRQEAYRVMRGIMEGQATSAQIAAFLIAEKLKGETYHEVAGFATAMREKATHIPTRHSNAIDMCGTGGDGKGTFNISTVASFVVAAGGVPVAKHGNRSVSSKCGSADLLESLGVKINLTAEQVSHCLDELYIGFLYAPALHTAMKHAVGPRREIGVRTVFNILGPLTNPAGVRRQLLGVFNLEAARLMAEVLKELGADHVLVLHSDDGLDEISIYAPTQAYEVRGDAIREMTIRPEDFGISTQTGRDVLGGTPSENARTALAILSGKEIGPARDLVVANAAGGLYVGGVAESLSHGAEIAREVVESGAALTRFEALRDLTLKCGP